MRWWRRFATLVVLLVSVAPGVAIRAATRTTTLVRSLPTMLLTRPSRTLAGLAVATARAVAAAAAAAAATTSAGTGSTLVRVTPTTPATSTSTSAPTSTVASVASLPPRTRPVRVAGVGAGVGVGAGAGVALPQVGVCPIEGTLAIAGGGRGVRPPLAVLTAEIGAGTGTVCAPVTTTATGTAITRAGVERLSSSALLSSALPCLLSRPAGFLRGLGGTFGGTLGLELRGGLAHAGLAQLLFHGSRSDADAVQQRRLRQCRVEIDLGLEAEWGGIKQL